MPGTQLQHRRGTAAECDAMTPAAGEIIYDTTNKRMRIGDGATLGGTAHPTMVDLVTRAPTWCGTAGGTANDITLSLSPAPVSVAVGTELRFLVGSTNTGPMTLNLNGAGTQPIKTARGDAAPAGLFVAGARMSLVWSGTNWLAVDRALPLLERLETYVPSGLPIYLAFVLPTGFSRFHLDLYGLAPSADGPMFCQLSTDGGANWLIGGTDYTAGWTGNISPGYGAAANGSSFTMSSSVLAGGSGGVLAGRFEITPALAGVAGTVLSAKFDYTAATPALVTTTFSGNCTSTTRPNAIRIGFASTTFRNQGGIILSGMR